MAGVTTYGVVLFGQFNKLGSQPGFGTCDPWVCKEINQIMFSPSGTSVLFVWCFHGLSVLGSHFAYSDIMDCWDCQGHLALSGCGQSIPRKALQVLCRPRTRILSYIGTFALFCYVLQMFP